jgi:membrane-bound ClpP family serine protease
MDLFDDVSHSLKAYFDSRSFLKFLLPLDVLLIPVGVACLLLALYIWNWGLFGALGFWILLLGLFLAVANRKWLYVAIGLFGAAAVNFWHFFWEIAFLPDHGFNAEGFLATAICVWLGVWAVGRIRKATPSGPV